MCDRARGFTRSVVLLAVLAVVTLMATSVAAQSTTGTILGRVTDPQRPCASRRHSDGHEYRNRSDAHRRDR